MKILKWLTVGAAVFDAAVGLRGLAANLQVARPEELGHQIAGAVRAVESAVGIQLPSELVERLVAADLQIVQDYWAKQA